jgi:methylmalonyl-CoA decarboxylase subunit alpha
MHDVIDGLVDAESFFEVKPLFAPELVVGFGLLDGRPVGIVANNPMVKGGVLFVDSADKAARSSGAATPSTSRWCSWPTCPGS